MMKLLGHLLVAGAVGAFGVGATPAYADTPAPHPTAVVGGMVRAVPGEARHDAAPQRTANMPSCRAVTYRGDAGQISVQTSRAGTVAWGIYLYDRAADAGPWTVDVYVGRRRVDHKQQNYAPHGSVSPRDARPGQVFRIDAVHTDLEGREYTSVPNACVIP